MKASLRFLRINAEVINQKQKVKHVEIKPTFDFSKPKERKTSFSKPSPLEEMSFPVVFRIIGRPHAFEIKVEASLMLTASRQEFKKLFDMFSEKNKYPHSLLDPCFKHVMFLASFIIRELGYPADAYPFVYPQPEIGKVGMPT